MWAKLILWAILGAAAIAVVRLGSEYYDPTSVSHEAVQFWLKLYGESVYEFHAKTGRWPASVEDLGETSLAGKFPYWRSTANLVVFLWPKDLKDSPAANSAAILGYYNKVTCPPNPSTILPEFNITSVCRFAFI